MSGLPQVKYSGAIRDIKIGKPGHEVVLGGETAYNFYTFEGKMPNAPKLALQVMDIAPEEWAPAAVEPFKDVINDPVAWAKKCQDVYKADVVTLWLSGTDPNGKNLSAEHAADVAKKVAQALDVPLIVWGVSSDDKNTEVLKAVCEACDGLNVIVGPVTEHNYKQVGAAAIAYKHSVIANTPIDINLAKQLNILLENLGVPEDRIMIDPTTGSVGYGLEYCYSIMERIRQSALTQNDAKLQYPIVNNIAEEVWKTKEAKLPAAEDPKLGEAATRGVNLEVITALSALQAGSDLLILRHPKTLEHLRKYISTIMEATDLDSMKVDMSLIAEAKPAPAAAKKAAPAAAKPAPAKPAAAPPAAPKAPKLEVVKPAAPAPVEEAPKPAAPAAKAAPADAVGDTDLEDLDLSEEDLAALRQMLGMFRGVQGFFGGIVKLVSGDIK
ncbi:MAG: acetyl-CoA decarbonylase/synthase complex subunit delta [Pseudomonadota bacterium]